MDEHPSLSPDSILIAEFGYLTQAAAQANEDRARVASFYLVSFGSFIAGLVTTQFNFSSAQTQWLNWGFAILFFALALMGLLTVVQLARLRDAWYNTAKALNHIKRYYSEHFENLNLSDAFLWDDTSLPPKFKISSVAFALVLQVSVLGGAAIGASAYMLFLALANHTGLPLSIFIGVLFILIQVGIYRGMLK